MRRAFAFVVFGAATALGLCAGYVVAASRPGEDQVTFCHSADGTQLVEQSASVSAIVHGHADDRYDVIPPMAVIKKGGKVTNYPGRNLDTAYGAGYPGAEVLANHCRVPSIAGVTETTATLLTETLHETVTAPPVSVAGAMTTTNAAVTATMTVPEETVTAPGATTAVSVPVGETATVTIAANTVTIPPSTVSTPGGAVAEPAETVTVPAATQTVITSGTLTAPGVEVIRGGVFRAELRVPVRLRARPVRLRARIIRALGKHRVRVRVIVIVRSR